MTPTTKGNPMTETSGREKVLEEALRKIAGGFFPEVSALAIAGDWHGFTNALQGIATRALASPSTPEPALRGGKVEEIAEEFTASVYRDRPVAMFTQKEFAEKIAAALRTYAGESAAHAGLETETIYRQALERISKSNLHDMNTLHPEQCAQLALEALSATRKAGGE